MFSFLLGILWGEHVLRPPLPTPSVTCTRNLPTLQKHKLKKFWNIDTSLSVIFCRQGQCKPCKLGAIIWSIIQFRILRGLFEGCRIFLDSLDFVCHIYLEANNWMRRWTEKRFSKLVGKFWTFYHVQYKCGTPDYQNFDEKNDMNFIFNLTYYVSTCLL